MRVIFMGTPDFAAVSLNELLKNGYNVLGVVCQPDRPSNRGMKIEFSPVKQSAVNNKIPVFQPEKLRDENFLKTIKEMNPDIIVVVAYGRIIPDEIIAVPRYGAINVHGSILPKYRGAAPIQRAVMNGDLFTGVTTMYLSSEMDAGDIIYSDVTPIGEFETSGELFNRLSVMGAKLLIKTLKDVEAGIAPRIHQDNSQATYAPMIDKSLCMIDWKKNPRDIIKQICGLQPWPVATAKIGNDILKIYCAEYTEDRTELPPGSICGTEGGKIAVSCGNGNIILITELQAPGKKRMRSIEYLRGHKI